MMMYLNVLVGFILLLGAAELLVRGAVDLAARLGVPPLVIGMTIVAFGTSAPELVISVDAVLNGATGLAVGNIVGSNIANILLILGVAAIIRPILDKPDILLRDALMLMSGSLLFAVLVVMDAIDQTAAVVFLFVLLVFLWTSYQQHSNGDADEFSMPSTNDAKKKHISISIILVIVGLTGLVFGAELLVDGGTVIARSFNVSEEVIGLTLLALGTSLPELAASVVAARRGHVDVAIGNVVGSNLFNMFAVGGLSALIVPLPVISQISNFDIWVMMASTVMIMPVLIWGWRVTRIHAVIYLALYSLYISAQVYGVDRLLDRI